MKMKSYKATFFRHNPQFKNGGYVTERKMRILWDSFSDDEKPEWTSLEEIETFSKKMLEEEIY